MKSRNLAFVVLSLAAVAVVVVLWPIVQSSRPMPHGTSCLSNVKQLTLAMLFYCEDWHLPARDLWMDAIGPYHRNRQLEHCTEVREPSQYGYAFSSLLERRELSKVENPSEQPMIYDSLNLARNASDPVVSLPKPGRHEGKNNIGYADGRASRRSL